MWLELLNRFRIVPMERIKQAIRRQLTTPKTIFVPLHFLDADWTHFREVMRSNRNVKFTRHYDDEDAAPSTNQDFVISWVHSWAAFSAQESSSQEAESCGDWRVLGIVEKVEQVERNVARK